MRIALGWWMMAASLGACVSHQARFVDIEKPKAEVVADLAAKAKAKTAEEAGTIEARLNAEADRAARGLERETAATKASADELRPLWLEKRDIFEARLAIASEIVELFAPIRARCNSLTDLRVSPMRCEELSEIIGLAKGAARRAREALDEATKRLERLGESPDSDSIAEPPAPEGEPERLPPGTPLAQGEGPLVHSDLSIEEVELLLASTDRELELDGLIATSRSKRGEISGVNPTKIEEVQIDVSFDSLRLSRFDYKLVDGKTRRVLRGVNRYHLVEVDGITRVLGDGEFDPEVADFLGVELEAPCIYGEIKAALTRCRDRETGRATGSIYSVTYKYPRTPVSPRALLYGAYDQELGGMLGLSHGVAAGLQWRSPEEGKGAFARLKLAALVGVNFDLAIDLSKEREEDPRFVAALTPELIFRAGRAQVFHLEPGLHVETRRESLFDVAVGPRFDSYGRSGGSIRATLRPAASISGLTVRYNRYASGRGSSIMLGLELADEAAILPSIGAVLSIPLALLIYFVATCDDPSKDNCGRE